jgi:N-acetylneuraminate lyase
MHLQRTRGLVAAPFTPYFADGSLNTARIGQYANWLVKDGVAGAFVCGTTGESMSLTTDERLAVAQAWVDAAPPELPVFVHVGHNSLIESKRLAAHAASIGAAAVAAMPPTFFKPAGIAGVMRWCVEIAAAAPTTPFYYYHIPSLTGVHLCMADLLMASIAEIPNFAGIKFTHEDMDDFGNCIAIAGNNYDILFGRDELLLTGLRAGAIGAVGSTYNFAAPLYLKLIDAFEHGDAVTAEACQRSAVAMIDAVISGPWHPIAGFKQLLALSGIDCGPTRLPLNTVTDSQLNDLTSRLSLFLAEVAALRAAPVPA